MRGKGRKTIDGGLGAALSCKCTYLAVPATEEFLCKYVKKERKFLFVRDNTMSPTIPKGGGDVNDANQCARAFFRTYLDRATGPLPGSAVAWWVRPAVQRREAPRAARREAPPEAPRAARREVPPEAPRADSDSDRRPDSADR